MLSSITSDLFWSKVVQRPLVLAKNTIWKSGTTHVLELF